MNFLLYEPETKQAFARVKAINHYRAALKGATLMKRRRDKMESTVWVRKTGENIVKEFKALTIPLEKKRWSFRFTKTIPKELRDQHLKTYGIIRPYNHETNLARFEHMVKDGLGTLVYYTTQPCAELMRSFYTQVRTMRGKESKGAWPVILDHNGK